MITIAVNILIITRIITVTVLAMVIGVIVANRSTFTVRTDSDGCSQLRVCVFPGHELDEDSGPEQGRMLDFIAVPGDLHRTPPRPRLASARAQETGKTVWRCRKSSSLCALGVQVRAASENYLRVTAQYCGKNGIINQSASNNQNEIHQHGFEILPAHLPTYTKTIKQSNKQQHNKQPRKQPNDLTTYLTD